MYTFNIIEKFYMHKVCIFFLALVSGSFRRNRDDLLQWLIMAALLNLAAFGLAGFWLFLAVKNASNLYTPSMEIIVAVTTFAFSGRLSNSKR